MLVYDLVFSYEFTDNGVLFNVKDVEAWDFMELVDWLAWNDFYLIYSHEDGWTYLIDSDNNVYRFNDYGFNLYEELKKFGLALARFTGLTVYDFINEDYESFKELVED